MAQQLQPKEKSAQFIPFSCVICLAMARDNDKIESLKVRSGHGHLDALGEISLAPPLALPLIYITLSPYI
jgi:hypothetical protein